MSVQIFLQGKVAGIEELLASPRQGGEASETRLAACSLWVALLTEVLPRALLAELGLSRMLLGSSGGGQFLVVLPQESLEAATQFLTAAAADAARLSEGHLHLYWAATENLGDWAFVRKRINEQLAAVQDAPLRDAVEDAFAPFDKPEALPAEEDYFTAKLLNDLRTAATVGWNPEHPAEIVPGEGKHTFSIGSGFDSIPLARHFAPSESNPAATLEELASRASGRSAWGVLRGDVDNLGIRFRRATTIEEHVELSMVFKGFFAGELEVICSMPEFWQKVTVLYSGGDDFAVYGAWDTLILLAREIQRLFHRLSEETLKELPGHEGKTVTMSLAIAGDPGDNFTEIYEAAGQNLELAKTSGKDCLYVFGRTLEWKQMGEAQELKDRMARMVLEFGASSQFLNELAGFYRDSAPVIGTGRNRWREKRFDRPWRFHRRLNRVLTGPLDREFQRIRSSLIGELIGKGTNQRKLRPAGRVALEWARLSTEE